MFRPLSKGAQGFDALIRHLGGEINASTRYGATVYTSTVSNGKLKEALKLESDRFRKLKVSDELLKLEREAVRSEYSMVIDSQPMMDLWFTLFRKGFPQHPYGSTIAGERADLDKISAKDCNEFFQKYYKPNNIGLFIAGDFDLEQAKAWVFENYIAWERGETPLPTPPFENKGFVQAEGNLPSQANTLLMGYRLKPLTEENFTLFTLADHILVESSNSVAKNRLVYQAKLATGTSSFNISYDFGLSEYVLELRPGVKFDQAIDEFLKLPADVEKLSDEEYAAYLAEYRYRKADSVLRNIELNESLALHWGKYGSAQALVRNLKKPPQIPKLEMVAYLKELLTKHNLIAVTNKQKKS